jgi:hypothetical protein
MRTRHKLIAEAIGRMWGLNRKDVITLNEEMELVKGKKLTQLELEVAYAEHTVGRSDLLPERYPELNGKITKEKSMDYWGTLYEVVEPMLKSDSPKWDTFNTNKVQKYLRESIYN